VLEHFTAKQQIEDTQALYLKAWQQYSHQTRRQRSMVSADATVHQSGMV